MKNSQLLALILLLVAGHGVNAAWIGYNNPFHEQTFEDNDSIRLRGDSFQQSINNKNNKYCRALLMRAMRESNIQEQDVVRLIEFGADVNESDWSGCTILHWAICPNKDKVIQSLLAASVDVNKKNKYGDTPLHYAAIRNANEAIITLLYAGADINLQNKKGDTPLHRAVRDNAAEMITLLLAAGADTTIVNDDGYTARKLARDKEICKIFDQEVITDINQINNSCSLS